MLTSFLIESIAEADVSTTRRELHPTPQKRHVTFTAQASEYVSTTEVVRKEDSGFMDLYELFRGRRIAPMKGCETGQLVTQLS